VRVLATYGNVHHDGTSDYGDVVIPHPRSSEHYARVERERLPGEPYLKALHRLAVEDAVAASGEQRLAAQLLGTTPTTICNALKLARERRVNSRLRIVA